MDDEEEQRTVKYSSSWAVYSCGNNFARALPRLVCLQRQGGPRKCEIESRQARNQNRDFKQEFLFEMSCMKPLALFTTKSSRYDCYKSRFPPPGTLKKKNLFLLFKIRKFHNISSIVNEIAENKINGNEISVLPIGFCCCCCCCFV